jgi:hypothetical protein
MDMKIIAGRWFWLLTIVAGLLFFGELQTTQADTYPVQLLGAWGGRAAFAGDDDPKVASAACESFRKNSKAVTGDLLVFQGSQKLSFGGEADYEEKILPLSKSLPADGKLLKGIRTIKMRMVVKIPDIRTIRMKLGSVLR